jgi:hypothetical protein
MANRMIDLDGFSDVFRGQCWSMWEGCVCAYSKDHEGPHECDDPNCHTSWTTLQGEEWMDAEAQAHRSGTIVPDRHRKR